MQVSLRFTCFPLYEENYNSQCEHLGIVKRAYTFVYFHDSYNSKTLIDHALDQMKVLEERCIFSYHLLQELNHSGAAHSLGEGSI
jgi:hypothetical protein